MKWFNANREWLQMEKNKKKMAEKIGKIWILSLKYNNLKETRSLSIIRYK